MKKKKIIFPLVLITYFLMQMSASMMDVSIYPFNSYRMFSKNWKVGTGLLEYRILQGSHSYRPAELLGIPFFQANRMIHLVYGPKGNDTAKDTLCSLLMRDHPSQPLSIYAEGVRYIRAHDQWGSMQRKIEKREVMFQCKV